MRNKEVKNKTKENNGCRRKRKNEEKIKQRSHT